MTDPTATPAGFPPAIMRTLAARRRALGMTQQDIAERIGRVTRSTVARWEAELSEPSLFWVEDYARAVGYDIVAQPSGAARPRDALCGDVEAERDRQTARLNALRSALDELYRRDDNAEGSNRGYIGRADLDFLRDALDGQPAEPASAATVPNSTPDAVSGRSGDPGGRETASGATAAALLVKHGARAYVSDGEARLEMTDEQMSAFVADLAAQERAKVATEYAATFRRISASARESAVCTPPECAREVIQHHARADAFKRAAEILDGEAARPVTGEG